MPTYYETSLNEYFDEQQFLDTIAQLAQPFLGKLKIIKKGARIAHERFTLAGSQAFGGTYAAADNAAQTDDKGDQYQWEVPNGQYFGFIGAEFLDVALSRDDKDAAYAAAELEITTGVGDYSQNIVRKLLGPQGGAYGQAEWEVTAGTPTGFPSFALRFVDPAAMSLIQRGSRVVVSVGDGSDAGHTQVGDVGYVYDVDPELGYLHIAKTTDIATPAAPTGWVDDTVYYVFRNGDFQPGNLTGQLISLATYITSTRATNSLAGVDRSKHAYLSGVRVASTDPAMNGELPTRGRRLMAVMAARAGLAHEATMFLHPEDHDTFVSQLESKTVRETGAKTEFGYKSITLNSPNGMVEIVPEPGQPKGSALVVDEKQLQLETSNGSLFEKVPLALGSDLYWNLVQGAGVHKYRASLMTIGRNHIGQPFKHGRFSTI